MSNQNEKGYTTHTCTVCQAAGVLDLMHGRRSRMPIDPRIPTMSGRSMSGFHRPDRHCLHQARSDEMGGVANESRHHYERLYEYGVFITTQLEVVKRSTAAAATVPTCRTAPRGANYPPTFGIYILYVPSTRWLPFASFFKE